MRKQISISKFAESFLEKGFRILKVKQYGVKTADECAPFGDDSNPFKGMSAVYAETAIDSEPIIIGYINNNQLADTGEKRLYSVDKDGNQVAFLWLKNNGKLLLNGDSDNLVRYNALDLKLKELQSLVNTELTKIASGVTTGGGIYVPTPLNVAINSAKVDNLRCS